MDSCRTMYGGMGGGGHGLVGHGGGGVGESGLRLPLGSGLGRLCLECARLMLV